VAAFWWALSTTSFVIIMGGLGLELVARRVTHVDLHLPMGMSFGVLELANDQGAAAVLVVSFVIGFLLTALSLWNGTAPFLVGKASGGRARNAPPNEP
jgi:hypothetical protein